MGADMTFELTRRGFLAGASAAVAATVLPTHAFSEAVTPVRTTVLPEAHPFMGLQKHADGPFSIVYHLRTRYLKTPQPEGALNLQILRTVVGEEPAFECMEDAEDAVLDRIFAMDSVIVDASEIDDPLHGFAYDSVARALLIRATRGGHHIAKVTRRGFGNTILVSPRMAEMLAKDLGGSAATDGRPGFVNGFDPKDDRSVGRWRNHYRYAIHGTTDMFSSSAIPDDKIVVLYKGNNPYDVPVVFTGSHLSFNDGGEDSPTFEDYVRVITLRNFPDIPATIA